MAILLDHNGTTGVSTYYADNPDRPGEFETIKRFDAQPLMDVCAKERAATAGEKFGDLRRVARIPPAFVGELIREGKLYDQAYMRQWLKEHSAFLTFEKTW